MDPLFIPLANTSYISITNVQAFWVVYVLR